VAQRTVGCDDAELHLTEKVVVDESVGKPDIGCGRFVTRGDTH
jgi:hypothetical protein